MAIIYMYKPLKEGETFTSNQLKPTSKAFNISFKEDICDVGEFEFSVPASDKFCENIEEGNIISIDGIYYGIIRTAEQNTNASSDIINVRGEDLKGYLTQRITLYPSVAIAEGLHGYDAINNVSTETVAKYFINNNIVNPSNSNRKIVGFTIAPDLHRGNSSDQYMSRFEQLDEVMKKNLEPLNMGYQVKADLDTNSFIFDVIQGLDRTSQQDINNRVIFDVKYKNLLSLQYFKSIKNYKNIFYASLSKGKNDSETLTCMYVRENEEESTGALRFEQHLNVSINLPSDQMYQNMKPYALKSAEEYVKTEQLTAVPTGKYVFALDYNLGDFVTVQARTGLFNKKFLRMDVQITSILHKWTNSGVIHELQFGKGRLSKIDVVNRKIRNGG